MVKKEKFMIVRLKEIEVRQSDARLLRGYFADLDYTDALLHNHSLDGKSIYRYPMIQYKIINSHPVIIAYGEAIRSLHKHLMEMEELTLAKKSFKNMDMDIELSERPIGDCNTVKTYQFLTPWLALNQKNYLLYKKLTEEEEKEVFLSKILIGNILSLCKAFGVTIENKLTITHHLQEKLVNYKGERMIGFLGNFSVNCSLPTLCGLGKGTARGLGTFCLKVSKKKEEEKNEI